MSDLKPCPFCGQIPEVEKLKWPNGVISYRIFCGNENCVMPVCTDDYNNEVSAVNAWNTRHEDKRKEDLLRDVRNLEIKLEELDRHLAEKDAIIRKQALMLAEVKDD